MRTFASRRLMVSLAVLLVASLSNGVVAERLFSGPPVDKGVVITGLLFFLASITLVYSFILRPAKS